MLAQAHVAQAQDTRAAVIADEQAEKAKRLAPREPTKAERIVDRVMDSFIEEPSGFYPFFGSVYSGGGFTLGAGYRRFTGDGTHWDINGLYSIKGYKLIETSVVSPGHAAGRIDLRARAGWRDATRVRFHGLGIESPADNASAFRMTQAAGGGDITLRPAGGLFARAGVNYEDYSAQAPTGGLRFVEDVHSPQTAPGAGADPTYFHSTVAAGFDWRPAAEYARTGGLYEVAHHRFEDRDDTYTFSRLDADVVQHIPILRENWVISLRGSLQTTLGDDDLVPYFLLPSLGSGSTLRGYSSWRFRDRHAVLSSAEFRWIASRLALDMALFYDAGMVAPELDEITLRRFASDYGLGVRFHGPSSTPLRVEIARGREGTRLVFAASAAF